jgi:hypothetical protein
MPGVTGKRILQAFAVIVVTASVYLWQRQGGAYLMPQPKEASGNRRSTSLQPSLDASTPTQTTREARERPETLTPEQIAFAAIRSIDPVSVRMHEAVMREPRDETWAREMEYRWSNAFAANTELLSHGHPVAECRSTQCEIRLLTYAATTITSAQWNALLTKGAERADWERQRHLVAHATTQAVTSFDVDGRTAVLLYVEYLREPLPEGEGADAPTSTAPPNSALQRTAPP